MSVDEPANQPLRYGWRTTVDLDGMTWGELRYLVALAARKHDEDEVEFEWDTDDIPAVPTGIILRGEG